MVEPVRGIKADDAKKLRELETTNQRPKKIVTDQALDIEGGYLTGSRHLSLHRQCGRKTNQVAGERRGSGGDSASCW